MLIQSRPIVFLEERVGCSRPTIGHQRTSRHNSLRIATRTWIVSKARQAMKGSARCCQPKKTRRLVYANSNVNSVLWTTVRNRPETGQDCKIALAGAALPLPLSRLRRRSQIRAPFSMLPRAKVGQSCSSGTLPAVGNAKTFSPMAIGTKKMTSPHKKRPCFGGHIDSLL